MRIVLSTVLLLFSVGVYAGPICTGNKNCSDNSVDNSVTNKAYGGDGGNSYSKAYGGNAYAKGGDAYSKASAYQGQQQGQYQDQGQYQGNLGINKAVGTGNSTELTFNSKATVDAEPAIAPAIAPGDPTAPCYATYGGSAAGGGVASIGFSAYKYDVICGALEYYRTVGNDAKHSAEAHTLVTVAYHKLLGQMQVDMGDTEFNKAMGTPPEGEATSAEYTYPAEDGGFMKVSFERVGFTPSIPGSEDDAEVRTLPDS